MYKENNTMYIIPSKINLSTILMASLLLEEGLDLEPVRLSLFTPFF